MTLSLFAHRWVTMVSILVVCAGLLWLSSELWTARDETEQLQEALDASMELSVRNRETLRELCRTNGIVAAILTEERDLRRELLSAGAVPRSLRDRWRLNQVIYDGFLAQLGQQTACAEVIRP